MRSHWPPARAAGRGLDGAGRRQHPGVAGECGRRAAPRKRQRPLAFVTYGKVKLANLRARPQLAVTFRNGLAVGDGRGRCRDSSGPTIRSRGWPSADALRLLLREVFTAAGGTHDDWDEYDRRWQSSAAPSC